MSNSRKLPAYPIFIKDPFFSIWSAGDKLNEIDTSFWTGEIKRTYGTIRTSGKVYSFMGIIEGVEKLTQTGLCIDTFRTTYEFTCDLFDLKVSFFSPLPINDYEIWACPVCYFEYMVKPKTILKNFSISLSLHEEWCYNGRAKKAVRGDVFTLNDGEIGYIGLARQHLFNRSGDRTGADWGYYFIYAHSCFYHSIEDFNHLEKQVCVEDEKVAYITGQDNYNEIEEKISGKMLIAFDDTLSISYFGEMLRGYYFCNNKTLIDAINFSVLDYDRICAVCDEIKENLILSTKKFGQEYLNILNASYRQVLGAHKLVKDGKGRLLLLSKECGSGGCVATVDVTYPTMPMLLLYNPELVKASIEPIFDFALTESWEYEFAPHDAGIYPFCNGQFYGILNKKESKYQRSVGFCGDWWTDVLPPYYLYTKGSNLYDYDKQMPVEECADMIIICTFYLACGGDKEYVKSKLALLTQWCNYLIDKGLVPENQLCTDDFLNHIDKNVNLAIKSIVAIGAFAKLLVFLGENGDEYSKIATERANELISEFKNSHLPLAFNEKDTFSMKYNLLADKFFELNLFGDTVINREIDVCLANKEKYGIPLDSRSKLTKTDWMMWMAALCDDISKQKEIITIIDNFLKTSEDRIPFTDLYNCETSIAEKFVNRTVQGSMFILLLKDKMLIKNSEE